MTSETFLNGRVTLRCGDSRDVLKTIPDCSIDSIVTDPPYALVSIVKRFGKAGSAAVKVPEDGRGAYARASAGFMGKAWDTGETAFATEFWAECLRVLKPGGHVVAFSGTRTYHRMACAIEDAGFEVRDMLSWLYGSGFPKSHNAGEGWGTALKPACEPVCFGRKSLIGTVALNISAHGTGAINIDGCRVASDEIITNHARSGDAVVLFGAHKAQETHQSAGQGLGRWPANIIHDGSEEVLAAFPDAPGQQGALTGNEPSPTFSGSHIYGSMARTQASTPGGGPGVAARFFYTAKADADDRLGSKHPTVKPVDLMQWLCRLVTPKGGTVLDPFAGTGTTGEAALMSALGKASKPAPQDSQLMLARSLAAWIPPPTGQEDLRGLRGRTIGPIGLKR